MMMIQKSADFLSSDKIGRFYRLSVIGSRQTAWLPSYSNHSIAALICSRNSRELGDVGSAT